MVDPVVNKGKVTVSTGYNSTATSIVLATGQGAELPDPVVDGAYNLPWYDSTNYDDPADDPNYEIVRVTGPAGTGDTKTIVRAQEGTAATNKNNADATYKMHLGVTAKTITDLEQIIHSDVEHNLNAFDLGERILGLMTSPIFLNVMCEDPGAGTLYDISGNDHDGTYTGTWVTAQRIKLGRVWKLNPDGLDNYITMGDHNDFSFGDGSNDSAVTFFGVLEVINSSSTQMIASKRDETTSSELREWALYMRSDERIGLDFYDESANVITKRIKDSGISVGWHSFAITYDGAGGATAGNTIKIYIDGILVASTATNNASYVAMENLTAPFWIGADETTSGIPGHFNETDLAMFGIEGSELSAAIIYRFHQLCLANYSEDGISL